MIIGDKLYSSDLAGSNQLRYFLFTNLYSDRSYIESLSNIIAKHIDCLSIEYSEESYSFTIKIKKTAMRKFPGFEHDPNFYYQKIKDIFDEFIHTHEAAISNLLFGNNCGDLYQVVSSLYYPLLCHLSCIFDNIIIIKL